MKKRTERISREAFLQLSRPESTRHSPFVSMRRFLNPRSSQGKVFVVTISKKEIPTAVKRNLLKRRYTHILRSSVPRDESIGVLQCIVKKQALGATYQELLSDARGLIRSLKT